MTSNTVPTTARPTVRTVTVAVESDANPADVLAVLSDPTRLPEWAPAFAERVEPLHGTEWEAVTADTRFPLHVVVSEESGTVDVLRDGEAGELVGARFRTVPRPGGGSVTTMTMPTFPGTLEDNRRAAQEEVDQLIRIAAATVR